jgi:hypothetical protein
MSLPSMTARRAVAAVTGVATRVRRDRGRRGAISIHIIRNEG